MDELLSNPAVQGGLGPLLAGLIAAAILFPVRLAGLAAAAGFFTAVYLTGSLAFEPLTATRKIFLLALAAPAAGVIADLAFKPTRAAGVVLGVLGGAASVWVFWSLLSQRPPAEAMLYGGGVALFVLWLVAFMMPLHDQPVRAGAAGLGLGLGAGIGAVLSASLVLGLIGIGLAAGCGGFLLLAMALGKRVSGGATLALSVGVAAAFLAAGAMLLAKMPWYALAVLALVPVAVRLPVPERAPAWGQAIVASIYTLAVAGGACWLAWLASRGAAA